MALAARFFGQTCKRRPIDAGPAQEVLATREDRMTIDLTTDTATWLVAEVLR
jgi:hypothetical protein